jgi:hypothetical protein
MSTKIHTVRFTTYVVDIDGRERRITLGVWRDHAEFPRDRIIEQIGDLQESNHRDVMAIISSEEVLIP